MTPAIMEDLYEAMEDTGNFMHTTPPPFPTIEHAVGIPAPRPPKLYTTNGLVTPFSRGITIPSREQGEADMHRRDSIRRGGR
jgi:hypothetical protein